MSIDLASFFADYDVAALRAKVLELEGIDIQGVYCLASGKRMGFFDESEILAAIDEIGTDDEESLIDDLLVRVVASMRPSPALNNPNRATIREMVSRRPVDAMAYLTNRLHGHRDLLTKRSEHSFQPLINRIAIHNQWSALQAAGLDLTPWIHWLLELDAKTNLHDIQCPGYGEHRQPLLSQVTLENHAELLAAFESWVFERLKEYDKRDKELLAQSRWIRGNTFARPAYVRSWLENPEIAKRKDDSRKKKSKVGRPATSPKQQKLNAETNEFLHLLEGILDGTIETAKPAQKPKPRVMTGGMLKLNVAKRTSEES
jgi:hypothetical protein